ncbi:hypothetical protein [Emticicia fluvialis]|uniref:hypothetical protein n=1 Tax=Emticicia fluvialis TaxID=2974474 RepID=UPI0021653A05|nr:hypothetical protein [Emticicia fluvialis]
MKKILYQFAVLLAVTSCSFNAPLKGKYQETPFITFSDKSKEEVWSKVIDIFAQKGITINVIDKSSGLIVSAEHSFRESASVEVNGAPSDPKSWVVYNPYGIGKVSSRPTKLTGNFNVRLKEDGKRTSININLTNLKGLYDAQGYNHQYEVRSTGVFEKEFAEMLK